MSKHVFKIEQGKFGISLTDPAVTDACSATIADFSDFTCQITVGALNASPNVTDETVPATWCDPESSTPVVAETSFEIGISYLQDPDLVAGLSRTLFEHDTETAWLFMGLDGDNPPKTVAKVRLVSGTIGGEARVTLVADATFPCDGKPLVCFGNETDSESVGGATPATGATAGTPGTWTPAGSTPPASVAALTAGTPNAVVASPATAWTAGQYVQTGTAGVPGQAHWSGAAWASAPAALAASSAGSSESAEKTES